MSIELRCNRLPDVSISLVEGGTINLSAFRGQKLVVFFCPTGDRAAADREIDAYRAMAAEFEQAGAWVIGLYGEAAPPGAVAGKPNLHVGMDPDASAFRALASFVPGQLGIGPERGTTFLIDRDGGIRAAWPGCGHASQALEVVHERP